MSHIWLGLFPGGPLNVCTVGTRAIRDLSPNVVEGARYCFVILHNGIYSTLSSLVTGLRDNRGLAMLAGPDFLFISPPSDNVHRFAP